MTYFALIVVASSDTEYIQKSFLIKIACILVITDLTNNALFISEQNYAVTSRMLFHVCFRSNSELMEEAVPAVQRFIPFLGPQVAVNRQVTL